MSKAPEIRKQLARWLDGEISLEQFEDWFLPETWNLEIENDSEAEFLADEIELNLSEYSDKLLTIADLRQEMVRIAHPFAPRGEVRNALAGKSKFSPLSDASEQAVVVGDSSKKTAVSSRPYPVSVLAA